MKKTMYAVLLLCICGAFVPEKPKSLLLLGDSISMQYSSPYLEQMLKGAFRIVRKQDNGEGMQNLDVPKGANIGNSRMALAYINYKLSDQKFRPDAILLNCGLHDIKRDPKTGAIAVDTAEYRHNLMAINALVTKRKIPLVWVRTTEVVDSIHRKNKGFNRYAVDLEAYNAIADEVWKQAGVHTIDLYTFTKGLGVNRFVDHVHYNEETRQLQAAYIAGALQQFVSH